MEYSWRTEEFPLQHFDTRTHLGFVAQDVEKILPDLVGTNKDGWKSIRSTEVIAVLVEAMKVMLTRHQESLTEINYLKSEMKSLKTF